MRVASLCQILLVGLCMTGVAQARNDLQTSSDGLPCNDACRAWLSWTPSAQDAPAGQSVPEASAREPEARRAPPVRPAARNAGRAEAPQRRAVGEPPASEVDVPAAVASRSDERASSERHGTPMGRHAPPVIRHRPSETEKAASVPVRAPAAPPPKEGPGDEGAARLEAASAASDAAILATPLYQPSSPAVVIHDVPADQPRPSGPNVAVAPDPPPDPPAGPPVGTVSGGFSPTAEQPAAPRSTRNGPDAEPVVAKPLDSAGTSTASTRFAQDAAAAPAPPTPPLASKAPAGSRSVTAPSSALPVSDLERLDEGQRPEAPAHGASQAHPWTWPLLLGGLALVSLVGVRRHR